jgi:thiamine biosynthesis protein ThiS
VIRVAGKERPWREGMTVADLLKELGGESAACPVVRVNDHYISRPNFDRTSIPDNAQIFLIPMIAGG